VFDFKTCRLKLAGLAPMVGVINSIIATSGIVILTSAVFIMPIAWSVLIGLFTFLLVLIAHYAYLVNYLKQKRDEMEVRFPTPHKNQ
jgi:amino acid permease